MLGNKVITVEQVSKKKLQILLLRFIYFANYVGNNKDNLIL